MLCERLGYFRRTTGDSQRTLGFYEDYYRLSKEQYEADPGNNNLAWVMDQLTGL